jgi:hypothetical protein
MTEQTNQAYREWQDADARAREAENKLKEAWEQFDRGGESPSAALMAEVSRCRAAANHKLTLALIQIGCAEGSKRDN